MPEVSRIVRIRNRKYNQEARRLAPKIGLIVGILTSLVLVAMIVIGFWYYTNLTQNLPSIDSLPALLEPPAGVLLQPTRLYDRTHKHLLLTLENPNAADREYLRVRSDRQVGGNFVSQTLIDATISGFEPGFWKNPGFSLAGIREGIHPTIAERLVSDLLLDKEPSSIERNLRERILAAQVIHRFGREKVLEWFLNSTKYGELVYGADAAARAYLKKPATDLSIAEAAMLTAMAEAPDLNQGTGAPLLSLLQQNVVKSMLIEGYVDGNQAQQAITTDIRTISMPELDLPTAAFTELVLKQLSLQLPIERVYRGGFEITTTLDYDLQLQSECASQVQKARILGVKEVKTTRDGEECEASWLLPTLQTGEKSAKQEISAEVIILDPKTGQILAFVSEAGPGNVPLYPATHSSGTILAPLLYLTGFSRGMSPASLTWDIPDSNEQANLVSSQADVSQELNLIYHGPVRARIAMVDDYLAASQNVLHQVGADNVWLTEKRFGISAKASGSTSGTTIADLYNQPVSLLASMQAYAVFAHQGLMSGYSTLTSGGGDEEGIVSPSILSVNGVDGHKWMDWTAPQSLPIVSPQLAYLITNVLSDEVARWPVLGHPNSLEIGRPAGAKAGLSLDGNGSWSLGYIPQLAIGVWVGYPIGGAGNISVEMSAGIWHALMQFASKELPVEDFEIPSGISQVQVCDPSGLLVSAICPNVAQEVFLQGNEPAQTDNLYQKFFINRETGLLATVFTPADMVEGKVYLVVPPDALEWAKETGIPQPPSNYDNIIVQAAGISGVDISNPKMFDQMKGEIIIHGSAEGSDFSYYRLQVGKGLNPQEWIQLGEDYVEPVQNGILGTWDTTGLQGLYVMQLQVVRQDKRIDQAVLQVTIDNTQPQLHILNPEDGEEFAFHPGDSVMLQISASDDLVVERAEFYVDDRLVTSIFEPPYIALWPEQAGEHILKVRVYDLAGNFSEATVTFTISK